VRGKVRGVREDSIDTEKSDIEGPNFSSPSLFLFFGGLGALNLFDNRTTAIWYA